nr:MAG TPA: hypothetical protein [Caudoviricetes sp.]DAL16653.1 MAG TPA_asm: hypothetical protein [Caudoviricetes sp.]DAL68987.1 MAG TPA: hypothetical protein [Caudoviricetes sp.]DAU87785.1 MAG TPA: hypothetical protein [Caudoviricetes sp.]DAZ59665.1 MAG TPA: hypothetical protein [Caudoviricetes sp.]
MSRNLLTSNTGGFLLIVRVPIPRCLSCQKCN